MEDLSHQFVAWENRSATRSSRTLIGSTQRQQPVRPKATPPANRNQSSNRCEMKLDIILLAKP